LLKLSARAALLALAACARQEPPPGGPPDVAPPQIVQIRPESGAVVPQMRGEAAIRFDEVIEEMAGAGGAGGAGGGG
jgi:hypothetical protein